MNRTLWEARHEAGYLDDIALTKADYRLLGSVSEPERSRILFSRALAELEADPARYVRLCLRRLRYFIFFDETNPKSRVLAYRLPHLGLTIFAAIGLVLAPPSLRKQAPADDGDGRLDCTLSCPDDRVRAVSYPDRAVPGDLGSSGFCCAGDSDHSGRSAAARYHIKGIGVVDRLAVVDRASVTQTLSGPCVAWRPVSSW